MKKLSLLGITALTVLTLAACSSNNDKDTAKSSEPATEQKESSTAVESTTKTSESTTVSSEAAAPTGDFVKTAAESNFDGTMLRGNSYSIKITDYKVIQPGEAGNEYGDQPVLAFWYDTMVAPDYDNSAPISPSTAWIMNFEAVQDNDPNAVNKLNVAALPDQAHLDAQSAEIKPGGTVASSIAYTLTDTETPVTLTAKDMLGTEYGHADFAVK